MKNKIFYFLFKRQETEEQVVIRWADILIMKSNYKGEIDIMSFYPFDGVLEDPTQENISRWRNDDARKIRDAVIAKLGNINGQLDIITKETTKYLEKVKAHLLNEGYIYEPNPTKTGWLLNDTGKQVKLFEGHKKYKEHKRRESLATKKDQDAKIYWWWRDWHKSIAGIIIGGILGLIGEHKLDIVNTIKELLSPKQTTKQTTNQKATISKEANYNDTANKFQQADSSSRAIH